MGKRGMLMNFDNILKSILRKLQNEDANNIRFVGYKKCYVKSLKDNMVKESSPVFSTKEEHQKFLKDLFHDYPLDKEHPIVKRHVNFNGHCFICTGIASLLTDSNEDFLYIRLIPVQ